MDYTQRGRYITLLCLQHQKGHLSFEDLNQVCENDSKVLEKFIEDENGLFYNERLEKEIFKRQKFIKRQTENGQKGGRPRKNKDADNQTESQEKTHGFNMGLSSFSCSSSFSSTTNLIEDKNKDIDVNKNINIENKELCGDPLILQEVTTNDSWGVPVSAILLISNSQIESLHNQLSPDELSHYLEKMREMLLDNYHFSCSHYEFILKMANEDRRIKKCPNGNS